MMKKLRKTKKMPTTKKTATTSKPRKGLSFWYNRHNRLGLLVVVLIFMIAGYFLLFSKAATPTAPNVYLTPSPQTFAANTTFTVQIRENSGATAVNSVEADFSYPTSLVTFMSISTTGTAFATVAQSTGGSGAVTFAGGVTPINSQPTSVTGDQLLATVTFKTLATGGNASLAFTNGTVLLNSSTNTDLLGSLANTTGATVTVDVTAPTTAVTIPANGATVGGGGTVSVTATASDTQSAIASVDFYIDGVKVGTDTTSPYTYSWNTAAVALGSHTLQSKATDSVGNLGSSTINTITLTDATPPTTPGTLHVTASTYTSISLAWTASTDNVGVTGYKITRNGATVTTVSGATTSYTDTGLTIGTSYNYSVTALDAANNSSSAATLTAPTSSQVAGDCDGDGHVGSSDLVALLANWHSTTALACDFNHNSSVDVSDLSLLLSHYGT